MRGWGDYLPWLTLALVLLLFGYLLSNDAQSMADREDLHRAMTMQREMLDARAEIQVMAVRSLCMRGHMSAGECRRVAELWHSAQYDRVAAAPDR